MIKFFFLPLLIIYTTVVHPLKVTFSKITFNTENEIRIETRFFLDDLTEHIENKYRLQHVRFSKPNTTSGKALQNYINERYYLLVNGEKQYLKIDNLQLTEDQITLKVFLSNPAKKTDYLEVYNNLLTEIFMNQEHKIIYNSEHITLNKYQPKFKL
jgi:hypothetical protein